MNNSQLNSGIPFTEDIRLEMINSVLEAFNQIDPESNLPNQNVSLPTQEIIVPPLSPIESKNPEILHRNIPDSNNQSNFYRNSLSASQLLFGDPKQVPLRGKKLEQPKPPSETEVDDFVNSLFV